MTNFWGESRVIVSVIINILILSRLLSSLPAPCEVLNPPLERCSQDNNVPKERSPSSWSANLSVRCSLYTIIYNTRGQDRWRLQQCSTSTPRVHERNRSEEWREKSWHNRTYHPDHRCRLLATLRRRSSAVGSYNTRIYIGHTS